jgi:hypothetical protein
MTLTGEAKWAAFEKQRDRLVASYEKATTPKARLRALAKLTRQHGDYMGQNMLTRGWVSETIVGISERMEEIAKTIK